MKTQDKKGIGQRKTTSQSAEDKSRRTKTGNVKKNGDTQSVMAEMKIRSGTPKKKK